MSRSEYLREFMGSREDLEAWVCPQVVAWDYRVYKLAKISKQHSQVAYTILWMLLQLKWNYMQRTVPGVSTLMGPI